MSCIVRWITNLLQTYLLYYQYSIADLLEDLIRESSPELPGFLSRNLSVYRERCCPFHLKHNLIPLMKNCWLKGIPMRAAKKMATTSPMLDDTMYRMNCLVLAKMALPSATADTMDAKLSSASTMSAACFATIVPEPIAMPMSALFSAGASLTPSPVMATTCPYNSILTLCCLGRDISQCCFQISRFSLPHHFKWILRRSKNWGALGEAYLCTSEMILMRWHHCMRCGGWLYHCKYQHQHTFNLLNQGCTVKSLSSAKRM